MYRLQSAILLFFVGASPLALMAVPAAARADSAVATATAADNSTAQTRTEIPEVIVTAERRSESLKNVPISVQAVTSEQVSKRGIETTQDLAATVPTLNFQAGNSSSATAFALRGVSSVAVQTGFQPSTALVLDGVPVAKQNEFVLDLGDIERIEVLNGPQGTLFGKNSTAGVINIVTRAPAREFQAMVEGLVTTDTEHEFKAMINVPISDQVRVRVNGFVKDQKPLAKNYGPAPDVDGEKAWGIDGKLAVDLTPRVNFLLHASQTHLNSSWGQFFIIAPAVFGARQVAIVGPSIGYGILAVATQAPAEDLVDTTRVTGTLNWQASDKLNFVSITNYTRLEEKSVIDSGGTPAGSTVGVGESLPGSTYPFRFVNFGINGRRPEDYSYVSEEARANYTSDRLSVVAGTYVQHYVNHFMVNLASDLDGSLVGKTPGQFFFSTAIPHTRLQDDTTSVFGDATYALNDQLKVFGGLRNTWETVDETMHRPTYLAPYAAFNVMTGVLSAPPIAILDVASNHKFENLSGRAGIEYQPNSQLSFYASYARGYKGPAGDTSSSLKPGVDPIIAPELAASYEIGAKVRLFDNRVAANIAVFDETIHNIQESVTPPNTGVIVAQILNAGILTTKGVEADAQFALTPELKLSAGLDYDRATYGGGVSTPCTAGQKSKHTCNNIPAVGLEDIAGQPAIGAPLWKYSLAGDYEARLSGLDMGYYAHVDWTWNSAVQYALGNDPLTLEPAHGILNANVGLTGHHDHWELQLFGRNLLNTFYYADRFDVGVLGQPIAFLSRNFHRYGGVRLTYKY